MTWTKIEYGDDGPLPETLPRDGALIRSWRQFAGEGFLITGRFRSYENIGKPGGCIDGGHVEWHDGTPSWAPGDGDWWEYIPELES